MFIYKYMHIFFQCLNMKTNTSSWTVSKADTHFQYPTSDSLKIYLWGNFTISVMSWNNSAPLDRTQTVSSQSNIISSFSTFMRVLFSLKYYHQYLNKQRMNAKTNSQIHTDNLYQGFYLLLHAIASLIYIRDGKEGLQEKSVTGKWIWRRLLLNYLVRFQKKKEINYTHRD